MTLPGYIAFLLAPNVRHWERIASGKLRFAAGGPRSDSPTSPSASGVKMTCFYGRGVSAC